MATPAVGCRVRILKDYATVRYIGTVAKQEGTWVGVEWDDPSRGKHDGSTAGVRYFECVSGANAGSFVRIERVCFGVSVLEATHARYNNETAEHGEEVAEDELYVHTSRKRRVKVQLVGEEKIQQKQRQIDMLESARLVGMDVSAVGDTSALSSSLPRLNALDLTSNLVSEWAFAEGLAAALPGLAVLNLSENRLRVPQPPVCSPPPPLAGLRVLVLNDCGLSWAQVLTIAPQLPCLEELHLCGNAIPALHGPPGRHPQPPPPASVEEVAAAEKAVAAEAAEAAEAAGAEATAVVAEAEARPPQTPEGVASAGQGQLGAADGASGSGGGRGGGGDEAAAAELLAALFPRLQVLTLEEAGLGGWSSLELLRRLPRLSRLHLGGNPGITHVAYPGSATGSGADTGTDTGAGAGTRPQPPSGGPPAAAAAAAAAEAEEVGAPSSSRDAAAAGASAAAAGTAGATAAQPGGGAADAAAPPGGGGGVIGGGGGASFPCLAALYLGGCGVAGWDSVDQLNLFPALTELRLSGNPVLSLSRTGGRFEVIGRVARLAALNGAEVRPRERRDSELRYLQHVAAEMEAAGGDEAARAAVRAAHPRLRELMAAHGSVLATAARGGPGGSSLAASTVELRLTCVAAAAHAKMGTQVKKLPKSTTVAALRTLCERLFKVPAARMSLFLRAPGEPLPEDVGGSDCEDRSLGFFGVQDGYEVLVDEVDPGAAEAAGRAAAEAAAAAHEARLGEQLRAAERLKAEFARSMGLQQQQQQPLPPPPQQQ